MYVNRPQIDPKRMLTNSIPSSILQIRAAAAFAGLKVDLPEHYVHFQDNKKPEFLSKFPHGKIPALDGADGFKVFETTAVARYGECCVKTVSLDPPQRRDERFLSHQLSLS